MYYRFVLAFTFFMFASSNGIAANMEAGKKIFEHSCAYCHRADYNEKFGPGLAGITQRRDTAWLDRFLLNPAEMIKTDEYARTLKESNRYGLTMPTLPEMQDAGKRQDVIEYLKTIQ